MRKVLKYAPMMQVSELADVARQEGIQAIGVAPVIPEVADLYPWAASVLCAAVSHLPPEERDPGDVPRGLVARFARSADYHVVVRSRLAELANGLHLRRYEICVDTTPLPERKLALLSGIGWIGRNGCVFVDGYGSYVSLGEIVTDLELPSSVTKAEVLCGGCRLCVDACPAGALKADGRFDRSRCISHLTQAGGEIPARMKRLMGRRIYGCDVCQEVCPHNAGLPPVNSEFAQQCFPGAYPELAPLIGISRSDFERTVRPSSIGWIGRSRLRRNAQIAADNIVAGSLFEDISVLSANHIAGACQETPRPEKTDDNRNRSDTRGKRQTSRDS